MFAASARGLMLLIPSSHRIKTLQEVKARRKLILSLHCSSNRTPWIRLRTEIHFRSLLDTCIPPFIIFCFMLLLLLMGSWSGWSPSRLPLGERCPASCTIDELSSLSADFGLFTVIVELHIFKSKCVELSGVSSLRAIKTPPWLILQPQILSVSSPSRGPPKWKMAWQQESC